MQTVNIGARCTLLFEFGHVCHCVTAPISVSCPQCYTFSSILVICLYCCSLLFTNRQRTFFSPCVAFISRPQGLLFVILNSNPMAGVKIQMYIIYGQEDQPHYVASAELNHSLCWLHFNIFNLALEGMLFWWATKCIQSCTQEEIYKWVSKSRLL